CFLFLVPTHARTPARGRLTGVRVALYPLATGPRSGRSRSILGPSGRGLIWTTSSAGGFSFSTLPDRVILGHPPTGRTSESSDITPTVPSPETSRTRPYPYPSSS